MVDKWMRLLLALEYFSFYFKPDRFNVVVKLYVLNGMSLTGIHVDAYASTDPVGSISAKEAEPIDVIKLSGSPWTHHVSCTQIKSGLSFSVISESSSILLKRLRAFRERNVYRAGWGKIWEGGGRVGCALGPLTGVIAQGLGLLGIDIFFAGFSFSKLLLFSFFFYKDGSDRLMKRASYPCCNFLCIDSLCLLLLT